MKTYPINKTFGVCVDFSKLFQSCAHWGLWTWKRFNYIFIFRPLENYIRTMEGVYRAPEKNSRKGLLAISMKDRVDKISSQDQEG